MTASDLTSGLVSEADILDGMVAGLLAG